VTAFAEQVALRALTSEFVSERRRLEGRIECFRTQHTKVVRDKSTTENKSRNLLEKLLAVEKEKEDLGRRLAVEKEGAETARTEAQAARAEAQAVRTEAQASCAKAKTARKHITDMELEPRNICSHCEKTKASTRARVKQAHTLFVEAYCELSTETAPFDKLGEEVGLRFLGWLQEELESLPSIAMGLMS
jgi:hypothetical protein